ncbi:hypothetical protein [Lactimicrobium massiliense]|uniref:hypothetical protein n=1 Tax=Lactimicrobium massiliense TaxID=2161814 RepID=UPI00107F2835|nr:hypothetical protein [Lactimicrobium massiliense]
MVVFYDDLTDTVFMGDGCNNSSFLFLPESTSISTYLHTLQKFKKDWMLKVRKLVICHDYDFVPLELIDNVNDCCERILNGSDDKYTFNHHMAKGFERWASKGGPDRLDGKFGNIVYNVNRVD